MKDDITNDPVKMCSDEEYGLTASGLLVTAGSDWVEDMDVTDNGIRFNYTPAAKIMAFIFFGVKCEMEPSNKGIVIMTEISADEVKEQWKEI